MTNVVERISARAAIVVLSLAVAGETAVGVNATSVNWDMPSFAILKVDLLMCRLSSTWDRECQIFRSDAQHAFDAVWSCLNGDLRATRCAQVRRESITQESALLDAVELAALPGHRSIPFAASNPWLADSLQQWRAPGLWADPHIGLLLLAALAVATNIASSILVLWSAHKVRASRSADRLCELRREMAELPSQISSEQRKIDWFDDFFRVIDLGLSSLPNSTIPLSLTEIEVAKPQLATTAALDALLGEDSFRGKGRSRRASKRVQKPAVVWIDRTERRKDQKLFDQVMIIDFVAVPITMRIKLKFLWLGNPGRKSRYQWKVEATFRDIDEGLVRTCPNHYGTKCLTWRTEFDFQAWEGDGEAEVLDRAIAWLASALQRKTMISDGSAATAPYVKSVNEVAWLKRKLANYPKTIQAAEAELDRLQSRGSLRRAMGLC